MEGVLQVAWAPEKASQSVLQAQLLVLLAGSRAAPWKMQPAVLLVLPLKLVADSTAPMDRGTLASVSPGSRHAPREVVRIAVW